MSSIEMSSNSMKHEMNVLGEMKGNTGESMMADKMGDGGKKDEKIDSFTVGINEKSVTTDAKKKGDDEKKMSEMNGVGILEFGEIDMDVETEEEIKGIEMSVMGGNENMEMGELDMEVVDSDEDEMTDQMTKSDGFTMLMEVDGQEKNTSKNSSGSDMEISMQDEEMPVTKDRNSVKKLIVNDDLFDALFNDLNYNEETCTNKIDEKLKKIDGIDETRRMQDEMIKIDGKEEVQSAELLNIMALSKSVTNSNSDKITSPLKIATIRLSVGTENKSDDQPKNKKAKFDKCVEELEKEGIVDETLGKGKGILDELMEEAKRISDEKMKTEMEKPNTTDDTKNNENETDSSIEYDDSDSDDNTVNSMIVNGRYHFRGNVATTRAGHIFYMFDQMKKTNVIMKVIQVNNKYGLDTTAKEEVKHLMNLTNTIYCPELLDQFTENGNHCLVFEQEISSFDRLLNLSKEKKFSTKIVFKIARDIAKALHYLHSFGVFHRDVRAESMLLSKKHYLQLCGYGQSCKIARQNKNGNRYNTNFDPKTDWRSLYNTKWSTPSQLKKEVEFEHEDMLQMAYSLILFMGIRKLAEAKDDLNGKVHFEVYTHSWLPVEYDIFLPLLKLLIKQKTIRRIDYKGIDDEIKKVEPEVCHLAPYHISQVDGHIYLH